MAARVVYLALVALGRVPADHAGRAARQPAVPDVHEQGDREPAACGSAGRWPALDLPEGEEPEILNYHGFAAQVLDRYGMLAGVEPGQRVLTQAQRIELCGRVLDEMTFDARQDRDGSRGDRQRS